MASIPSNYELNIARDNGRRSRHSGAVHVVYEHFARVELGQCAGPDEAQKKAQEIARRFAGPEWSLTLTHWECSGKQTSLANPAPRQPEAGTLPGPFSDELRNPGT